MAHRAKGYDQSWWGRPHHRYDTGIGYSPWVGPGGRGDYGYRTDGYDYPHDAQPATRSGYDWNFKSRRQTNYGDPFKDRVQRTPFRVRQGQFEGRGRGSGTWRGYGREDYGRYPDRARYDDAWWW